MRRGDRIGHLSGNTGVGNRLVSTCTPPFHLIITTIIQTICQVHPVTVDGMRAIQLSTQCCTQPNTHFRILPTPSRKPQPPNTHL